GVLVNQGQVNYSTIGTISNLAVSNEGTWVVTGSSPNISTNGGASFSNSGLLRCAHSGTFSDTLAITSSGTVQVDSGRLSLANGAESTSGTWNCAAGAFIDFSGGFKGSYTGTGAGTMTLASSTVPASG